MCVTRSCKDAAAEMKNVIFGTLSCAVCYLTKPSSIKPDAAGGTDADV